MIEKTPSADDIARWEADQDSAETYAEMLRVWSRTLNERKKQLKKERADNGKQNQ